jgi:glucose/arabinose dehydrogenase
MHGISRIRLIILVFVLFILAGFVYITRLSLNKSPIELGEKITLQDIVKPGDSPKTVDYKIGTFTEGLVVPWSIVFTSAERALVTERNGNIRQVVNGKLLDEALIHFDEVEAEGEAGLMGMALHPNYSSNKYIYVCLAYESNGLKDKVERLVDNGSTITRDRVVIDNIPAAHFHAGCRVKFGPDGKLYVTIGDASARAQAQDEDSLAGKILRMNDDGTKPSDNPLGNEVWSLGHRNPQGIAWNKDGILYETEHGPSGFDGPGGGDEVNIIKKGANYGWPVVSHERHQDGMEDPKLVFTPAEAPSGATFYTGDVFPQFKNNFFFTALKGEGIFRVVIDDKNPEEIVSYEKLNVDVGRVREILEGPDGLIYFATSNRDGRGNAREGDDRIYRLEPK